MEKKRKKMFFLVGWFSSRDEKEVKDGKNVRKKIVDFFFFVWVRWKDSGRVFFQECGKYASRVCREGWRRRKRAEKSERTKKKLKRKYKFLNEKRDEGDILPRRKKASGKRK